MVLCFSVHQSDYIFLCIMHNVFLYLNYCKNNRFSLVGQVCFLLVRVLQSLKLFCNAGIMLDAFGYL